MALIAAVALLAAEERYHWPLDLPREITSSFGEFRPGRFHAGIDLRTGGNGRICRAIGDGYISRVRCSPFGYGKAVYLQLDDGNSAIYAHLDDFTDAVREYVRQAQHAQENYTVDLHPPPGQFRVKRGEEIARSGETGTNVPHLHFELRDPAGVPICPYEGGMRWPDSTRPEVNKVLVAPDGADGLVRGDVLPVALPVEHLGHGRYRTAPVAVSGRVGVGVDVIDPAPGGSRLGIHTMRLLHNGDEQFRIVHDRISYEQMGSGRVAYHPYQLDDGRFLLLWRWPGNAAEIYAHADGPGWVDTGGAAGEIEVQIEDTHGNSASILIPVAPAAEEPEAPEVAAPEGTGAFALDCRGNALIATLRFSAPEPQTPELRIIGPQGAETVPLRRIDAQTFRSAYAPDVVGQYQFNAVHPRMEEDGALLAAFLRGQGGLQVALDELQIEVDGEAPYGLLPVRVRTVNTTRAARIPKRGQAYALWPEDAPIQTPVRVSFPMPDGIERLERVHLYRMTGGGWSRENTTRRDGRLVLSTTRFGTYMALEDDQPPQLSEVLPAEGYRATTRRPYIRAQISDVGSGIQSYRVTCAGKWLLVEYDPQRGRIQWLRDEELPPGEQEVVFTVTDHAGNETVLKRKVVVPGD